MLSKLSIKIQVNFKKGNENEGQLYNKALDFVDLVNMNIFVAGEVFDIRQYDMDAKK